MPSQMAGEQLLHSRPLLLTTDHLSADDLSRVLITAELWMPVYSTRVAAAIIGAPLPQDGAASGAVPAPRQENAPPPKGA